MKPIEAMRMVPENFLQCPKCKEELRWNNSNNMYALIDSRQCACSTWMKLRNGLGELVWHSVPKKNAWELVEDPDPGQEGGV